MDKVLRCIWNIPCVGGFCAPTINPEESCARHFSNEYTLPASGIYMKVGPLCEWSPCCRFLGSRGVPCGKRNRTRVMVVAFAVSFFSWFLLLYPTLSISTNEGLIMFAPWATGTSHHNQGQAPVEVFIGLKGRVDVIDCNKAVNRSLCVSTVEQSESLTRHPFESKGHDVYRRVVVWSDADSCAAIRGPYQLALAHQSENTAMNQTCLDCRKSVSETVTFAIMGAITQIPQMTTDLQRSTPFGDVNCQATMGFLTSLWGCFSALMSLRSFSFNCWRSFPSEIPHSPFTFEWRGGPAFWCLVAASVLKLWDAFSHLLVPTPSARHTKPKSDVTDLEDYMMMAVTDKASSSEGESCEASTDSDE